MANKTIPQTAHIKLPEKAYFTLPEVAERWTRMSGQAVSVDDVLHYEETGDLIISAYLPAFEMVYIKVKKELDGTPLNFLKLLPDKPFILEGVITPMLGFTTMSSQIKKSGFFGFGFLTASEFGETIFYVSDKDGNEAEAVLPADFLRVTLKELKCFEEAHAIDRPAQLPKPQDASEDTKADRLERVLGALALGLAKASPRWKNGDAPNVSGLTAAALDSIKQNDDGSRLRGYGESTMRETISSAIKAVQKDKATR